MNSESIYQELLSEFRQEHGDNFEYIEPYEKGDEGQSVLDQFLIDLQQTKTYKELVEDRGYVIFSEWSGYPDGEILIVIKKRGSSYRVCLNAYVQFVKAWRYLTGEQLLLLAIDLFQYVAKLSKAEEIAQ